MNYDNSEYEKADNDTEVIEDGEEAIKGIDVEIVKENDVEVVSNDVEVIEKPEGDINKIFLEESKKSRIPLSRLYLFEYEKLKLAREMTFLRLERLEKDRAIFNNPLKYDITEMDVQLMTLRSRYFRMGKKLLNLAYTIFSLECMTCPKSKRLQAIHQNLQRAFKRLDLSTIINNDYCKKCPFYDPHKRVILSLYQKFKRKKKIRPWYGVRGGGYKRRPKSPFRRM